MKKNEFMILRCSVYSDEKMYVETINGEPVEEPLKKTSKYLNSLGDNGWAISSGYCSGTDHFIYLQRLTQ